MRFRFGVTPHGVLDAISAVRLVQSKPADLRMQISVSYVNNLRIHADSHVSRTIRTQNLFIKFAPQIIHRLVMIV